MHIHAITTLDEEIQLINLSFLKDRFLKYILSLLMIFFNVFTYMKLF